MRHAVESVFALWRSLGAVMARDTEQDERDILRVKAELCRWKMVASHVSNASRATTAGETEETLQGPLRCKLVS